MRHRTGRALRATVHHLGTLDRAIRRAGRHLDMLADRIDPPPVPDTPEPMLTADQWRRILDRT